MQFAPAILQPCVPSDLDTLIFTEDSAFTTLEVKFYIDGALAYNAHFVPTGRTVTLRGVASLINDLTDQDTQGLHTLSISYKKDGGAETYVIEGAKYVPCRKRLQLSGYEFFKTSFLTAAASPRLTTVYSTELLSWVNLTAEVEPVNITAEWLTEDDDVVTSSHVFTAAVNNGIASLNVSYYMFYADRPTTAKSLLRYVVAVGDRRHTYVYDTTADSAAPPRVLAFKNLFGVTDTLLIRGEIVRTDKPEYTSASVYGAVKNYAIESVPTFKANTGRLPDTALELLADAATARSLWLADAPDIELTLTEAEIENSSRYDGTVSGTLTWREAHTDRLLAIGGKTGKVFDQTFDITFI